MLKTKDSRHFVFLLFIISLIFVFSTASCQAIEINGTNGVMSGNLENIENSLNEIREWNPSGNTFDDIQRVIFDANDGDTIVLDQDKYVSTGNMIYLNKQVNIVGKSGMTPILDAKGLSGILNIEENGINVLIKNCEFRNGIMNYGGAILIAGRDIEITDCTFKYNEANSGGGAIYSYYVTDPSSIVGNNVKISNCKFIDNTANTAAGALGLYGDHTQVINCLFDSNKVYNKKKNPEAVYGGAIQIGRVTGYTDSKCVNCTFINNVAISTVEGYVSHGGAGCIREGSNFIDCIFRGNKADFGGALVYHSSGNVERCIFEENIALSLYGGALSCGMNTPTMNLIIKDSTFNGNLAPVGGACFLKGENIIFNNCNFNNNHVTENGGAVYIKSKSTGIFSSEFNRNVANVNGGAVYIDAEVVTIQNNSFNYNEAIPDVKKYNDGLGGALYINSSETTINSNFFKYNTARNGSAVYIDRFATRTVINNNEMFENQAWVYKLPIYAPVNPVLYGSDITIKSIIHGGNNIGKANNIAVSNAIYNNALTQTLTIDGTRPLVGATSSGELYQDDREFNTKILLTVTHEDGTVVYSNNIYSNVYGEVSTVLKNLKVGKYQVTATHVEDTYYKTITNVTTFTVDPQADVKVTKMNTKPQYNYKDCIMWNITIKNSGPNKATEIVLTDILPDGLIWISDNSGGKYNPVTGVLSLNELDISSSITLLIVTQINKTGKIINNANISAKEYDPDLSNNHDLDFILVDNSADVTISETVSNKNPNFSDNISWTLIATNNGPDCATEVNAFDILPEGLIWISDDSNGKYNPNTGVWTLETLNNGETKSLTIVCCVNKTGRLTNNASITCKEYDWNLDNNRASEFIDVSKAADLEVSKLVNNSNPRYLDIIEWTVLVKNNGPDDSTGVILTDLMPDGLIILSHNGGDKFDGIKWNVGNLTKYESKKLVICCKVNKTGNFVNFVQVECNEYDYNIFNNNASKSIHVDPASDLEVKKTVDKKNPIYKDTVHWVIEIKNNGPDMATEVIVTDVLPYGLTYIKNTASKGNYDATTGLWKINSIAPFTSEYLDIYCSVDKTGLFKNNVSVIGHEYDYNMSNNDAFESIFVNKTIDLSISLLVNNTNPDYKQSISWSFIATNYGPDIATGVKVLNNLPNGLIWTDIGSLVGSIWDIGILNVGESKTLKLFSTINRTGYIDNFVSIFGNELEINLDNNNDSESIYIRPAADLEVIKTSSKLEYFKNEVIDYIVEITNNGPNSAHNVVLEDILDSNIEFVSFSSNMGSFSEDGSKWTLNELNQGQSATLSFRALANDAGTFLNKASVSCDEYDYNPFNNMAELSVLVKEVINNITSKEPTSNSPLKIVEAYKYVKELEKTGSPITVLVIALTVLISFGFSYFQKN